MADDAVLDAGLDAGAGDLDAATEEAAGALEEAPDTGAKTASGEADSGETAQGEPPTSASLYKRALALDPDLAKGIRKPLFEAERWAKEVPGGIAEVRQLRQTVERLGGEEGIREVAQEMEGWRQFDESYMAGDPKVIDFMINGDPDDPQSAEMAQAAFLKLAPTIFSKYAEMDANGFTAYVMQQVQSDAYQAGIPLALMRLEDFLQGDDPTVKAARALFDQIKGYFTRVEHWAKQPTTKARAAADPSQLSALDRRQKDLDTREATATRNDWNNAAYEQIKPIYESEYAKLLGNRKISEGQKQAITDLFGVRYKAARATALTQADRYFKAKDRAGFVKFTTNSAKELIPRVMREVFDSLLPGKPGPVAGRPGVTRSGLPVKAEPGFTLLPRQPKSDEFDWSHPFNTPQNIQAGKGILVGGKRVNWRK